MVINAIPGSLRRFVGYFVTYRWELCLLIVIPFITLWVGSYVIALALNNMPSLRLTPMSEFGFGDTLTWQLGRTVTELALLLGFYIRVRLVQRDLLRSVWRYAIALELLALVEIVAWVAVSWIDPIVYFFREGPFVLALTVTVLLARLALMLWFARQLSRNGVVYGFFLVAYAGLYKFTPVTTRFADDVPAYMVSYVLVILGIVGLLLIGSIKAWLLGDFDRRGDRFQKAAIGIFVAVVVLAGYLNAAVLVLLGYAELVGKPGALWDWVGGNVALMVVAGLVGSLGALLVFLGLVYAVRVRSKKGPAAADGSPLPAQAPTPIG